MQYLNLVVNTLHRFAAEFVSSIPNIVLAIILVFVIHLVSRITSYLLFTSLKRTWMRPNLIQIFLKLTTIFIWLLGILIITSILFPSVTPAHIIGALGLTSVALGFAFKDISENFM